MTKTSGLPAKLRTTTDVARPMMPILIQVPALSRSTRRPRTSRRRLRREVRYAGLALMSLMPLGVLFLMLGGARPADRPMVVAAALGVNDLGGGLPASSPRITLLFDPTAPAETVPVNFPGYLLPVDGPEDPVHAGR